MLSMEVHKCNKALQRGFTIIELVIVIVIIAILATITFVSYVGITQRAASAELGEDTSSAYKQLQAAYIVNGQYPTDTSAIKKSSGTTFQYTVNNSTNPPTFCLTATNPNIPTGYNVSSTNGTPTAGLCAGHVQNPPTGSAPVITSSPPSGYGTSVIIGNPITLTAGATGSPTPTVQWQMSTSSTIGTGPWVDIAGGDACSTLSVAGYSPEVVKTCSTSLTPSTLTITTDSGYYPYPGQPMQVRAVFTNSSGTATTNASSVGTTYD